MLFLNKGFFKAQVGTKSFLINVDETNPIDSRMIVEFNYSNGVLKKATVEFKPKIHIAQLGNQCASIGFSRLVYDEDGTIEDGDFSNDSPQGCGNASVELFRFLEFNLLPNDLLQGQPLQNTKSIKLSDNKGNIKADQKPFIRRVRFSPSENQEKALSIIIKENSTLFFSRTAPGQIGLSNFVTTQSKGNLLFQLIDLNLESKELSAQLRDLNISIANGTIGNNDAVFKFEQNTMLSLQNIALIKNGIDLSIDANSGNIKGSIGRASFITIFDQPRVNKFLLNDGCNIELIGFQLKIGKNQISKISFDVGSRLKLNIIEGTLSLGKGSFIALGNSNFDANISCIYETNQKPKVVGAFNQFDAIITHGNIKLNSNTELRLAQGNISSNGLAINSAQTPIVTGVFKNFSIIIEEDSKFGIPSGFEVITSSNGTIASFDPLVPTQLIADKDFITGKFHIKIPIKRFFNNSDKKFALNGGNFYTDLELNDIGEIICSNINITQSSLQLTTTIQEAKKIINIPLEISKGTASLKKGKDPILEAKVGFTLPKTNDLFNVTIGEHLDSKDDRIFYHRVVFKTGLKEDVVVEPFDFKFNGKAIDFNTSFKANIVIDIPEGCGEKEGRTESCNGDGPDRIHKLQEVVRVDCPFGSRGHVYAKPAVYTLEAGISAGFLPATSELSVEIKTLKSPTSFGIDRDGCDDFFAGLAGGLISLITPIPIPVSVILAGSIIDNEVDKLIQETAYDFVSGFSKTLKVKL